MTIPMKAAGALKKEMKVDVLVTLIDSAEMSGNPIRVQSGEDARQEMDDVLEYIRELEKAGERMANRLRLYRKFANKSDFWDGNGRSVGAISRTIVWDSGDVSALQAWCKLQYRKLRKGEQ